MMQARINHPAMVVPDALKSLQALGAVTQRSLPEKLLELVHLRASQINGCSVCLDMHAKSARKAGETDERLFAVAAWRDTPYFSAAERAALALTEALTRISDRDDPVPDAIWNEADRQFDEAELAALNSCHRQHQRLEQAQRRGTATGRRMEGVRRPLRPCGCRDGSRRPPPAHAPIRFQ